MDSPKIIVLRAGVVCALLAFMPLLVLPPVVAQIDALLYPLDAALLPAPRPATEEGFTVRGQGTATNDGDVPVAVHERQANPVREDLSENLNQRIETAQRRLQDLGACYMLLEAAGDDQQSFHFHCQMPVGGSQVYMRPFDAVGRDPAATMEQVVAAVEAWRIPTPMVQTAERTSRWK